MTEEHRHGVEVLHLQAVEECKTYTTKLENGRKRRSQAHRTSQNLKGIVIYACLPKRAHRGVQRATDGNDERINRQNA